MQIQFNTDGSVEGSETLIASVEADVQSALERYGDRLTRVEVPTPVDVGGLQWNRRGSHRGSNALLCRQKRSRNPWSVSCGQRSRASNRVGFDSRLCWPIRARSGRHR